MKDLSTISKKEREEFFNSFDYVFCDVDGVLWHSNELIPGSLEAIKSLQALGKKIIYVSNNCTKTQEVYYNQLKSAGFNLQITDLVRPALAVIDFLKKCNLSKEIYLIGMTPILTELQDAGFKVQKFNLNNPEESVPKYVQNCMASDENVGAVVADIDVNMTVAQLQKAATYLKNPEVIFITGGADKTLCFGPGETIIGPGSFHAILEDMSGRKAHCLAKPSKDLGDFLKAKIGIGNPKRVLFVGDSIPEDMGFATNNGYQKMLVLSGLTPEKSIADWKYSEKLKPDYYAKSLDVIHKVLSE